MEFSGIDAVELQRNFWFPIVFKSSLHIGHFKHSWVLLNFLQRLFLLLDLPPLSRFLVQSRVPLEDSGKISLLKCYRTADSVCRKHLYLREASFKNRTTRNKARLSSGFFFFLNPHSFSLFLSSLPFSMAMKYSRANQSLSACIHIK